MAKLLHTADVHLTPDDPERVNALEELLQLAEQKEVDVVTIGGDLFDSPEDVEALRSELRNEFFSDRPFQILLIPGNHDVEAYRGDVFFGDACTVITDEPFEQWTDPNGDLRITGLPYMERPDDELLLELKDRDPFEGDEVLLLHCSLDAPFDSYETGDEGHRRYFPVTENLLTELGFKYYLAGHYHSPHKVPLANGVEFTYPGTPASTAVSETGRRRVSLLDLEDGIQFETIDTFHYATREFTVSPGSEQGLFEDIRNWAEEHAVVAAEASVHVDGFIEMGEDEFADQLSEAAAPADVTDDTLGFSHLVSRPLFQSFEEGLQEQDWDDATREKVWERTVSVFNQLASGGEI